MQGGSTVTPNERKDYIANLMLKRGVNKNSIIAMLCNAYTESAHTFDPKINSLVVLLVREYGSGQTPASGK